MKTSYLLLLLPFLLFSCSKSSEMTTKTTPAAPITQVPSQPTAPVITTPKSYAYAALYSSYQLKYESKTWVDMNTLRLKITKMVFLQHPISTLIMMEMMIY
jgi:hypothetical protein